MSPVEPRKFSTGLGVRGKIEEPKIAAKFLA
jgi:hypothetical protein